jgi:hypothetical protein
MYNPSLREEPLDKKPTAAVMGPHTSILDWLESTGRLLARDASERDLLADDEEIEEINELIIGDDNDDFDDDDDADLDD